MAAPLTLMFVADKWDLIYLGLLQELIDPIKDQPDFPNWLAHWLIDHIDDSRTSTMTLNVVGGGWGYPILYKRTMAEFVTSIPSAKELIVASVADRYGLDYRMTIGETDFVLFKE